jgi:DNA (cytosine-5)-methyltransferase 1
VAELFCGCGGLSTGFRETGRFDVVLGNDVKPEALRTFEENHAESSPEIISGDIRQVPTEEIEKRLRDRGIEELDCLVGGPPCQGFSQMRRSNEREQNELKRFGGYNRLDEDDRNDLVLRFLEVVEALRPKVVLIENVAQMLRHTYRDEPGGVAREVKSVLRELGYATDVQVLNAADYGVPQLRERVFFLASRVGPIEFPARTHRDPKVEDPDRKPWNTVKQAIGDLPLPAAGPQDSLAFGPLDTYQAPGSDLAKQLRNAESFPNGQLTRTYNRGIMRTIKEMRAGETWDSASARMRKRYEALIEERAADGESREAVTERLVEEGAVNPVFFRDYYWSAYTRLDWDRPALTITANANFLGSGRFTHPEEQRGITVREAARLQTFPDDFKFVTGDDPLKLRIGVAMDMIGEAVPPLLARSLATRIAEHLDAAPQREPTGGAVAVA